jgi:hypothetical protein
MTTSVTTQSDIPSVPEAENVINIEKPNKDVGVPDLRKKISDPVKIDDELTHNWDVIFAETQTENAKKLQGLHWTTNLKKKLIELVIPASQLFCQSMHDFKMVGAGTINLSNPDMPNYPVAGVLREQLQLLVASIDRSMLDNVTEKTAPAVKGVTL